jgi:hypothetical protein
MDYSSTMPGIVKKGVVWLGNYRCLRTTHKGFSLKPDL